MTQQYRYLYNPIGECGGLVLGFQTEVQLRHDYLDHGFACMAASQKVGAAGGHMDIWPLLLGVQV